MLVSRNTTTRNKRQLAILEILKDLANHKYLHVMIYLWRKMDHLHSVLPHEREVEKCISIYNFKKFGLQGKKAWPLNM